MRRFFHLLVFVLVIFSSIQVSSKTKLAGQALLDSLQNELPKLDNDSNKVKVFNKICYQYIKINPDSGMYFGKQALLLSKELDYSKGEVNSLNRIGAMYLAQNNNTEALDYFLQSLKLSEELDYKTGESKALLNIGVIYSRQYNYPKALEYNQRGLKISKELGNKQNEANALNNIGFIYKQQSIYTKALEYYQQALKIIEDIGDNEKIPVILLNLGTIYFTQSNYSKALNYYNESLKISEELSNYVDQYKSLVGLGNIYQNQLNYTKALEYFQKSLKIGEEMGNLSFQGTSLSGIGTIYGMQSNYPKALEYLKKGLKIFEEFGNKSSQAGSLINIGIIYKNQSNYIKALEYYQQSLKINEEIGNLINAALVIVNIGELYVDLSIDSIRMKQPEDIRFDLYSKEHYLQEGIDYLQQSIVAFDSLGAKHRQSNNALILAKAYAQQGNFKKAYESHIAYKALNDTVHNEEQAKKLGHLTADREQREAEIAEEEQARINQEKDAQRNRLQYLGLGVMVVVLLIGMLFSGVIKIPDWSARALVFLTFIFLFEFVLVLIDPWTDEYSEGVPIVKFAINMGLALFLFPLHHYFEGLARKRVLKNRIKK